MCSDYFGKIEMSFFIYAYPNLLLTLIPPYHEKNYSNDLRSFDSY
ncbi:hypothetical protein SAMN06265349_1026 [Flavobacterium resistens]|uniref:Uncharacterized protein n=1 Tax=Flavobacterium resistens TaxID=443612 RepID=A0A521BXA9_9FLAO|nr:hypothetical protein SAMN06265349_1026 [Flavobacterium resistens]